MKDKGHPHGQCTGQTRCGGVWWAGRQGGWALKTVSSELTELPDSPTAGSEFQVCQNGLGCSLKLQLPSPKPLETAQEPRDNAAAGNDSPLSLDPESASLRVSWVWIRDFSAEQGSPLSVRTNNGVGAGVSRRHWPQRSLESCSPPSLSLEAKMASLCPTSTRSKGPWLIREKAAPSPTFSSEDRPLDHSCKI